MKRHRVAVLVGHSLFAGAIANRLQQHHDRLEVESIDPRASDAQLRLIAAQPATVILDATDRDAMQCCSLDVLVRALPTIKIIYLNSQADPIEIVECGRAVVEGVNDLIDLIDPVGPQPPGIMEAQADRLE
jgi:DNA-binding NarL/FixJ family response regulator